MPEEAKDRDRLAVIVLNWNGADRTISTVSALRRWHRLQPRIIVVDNASGGDDVTRIEQAAHPDHLIVNRENLGFAGGNNKGIEAAIEAEATCLLLLNNDAAIEEDAVLHMIETLRSDASIAAIGPTVYEAGLTPPAVTAGGRNIAIYPRTRIRLKPGSAMNHAVREVDYAPGTALLLSVSALQNTGLFDPDYFFSGEVADWCRRAREAGFRNVIDTGADAIHRKTFEQPEIRDLHAYYSLRNRFLFILRHYKYVRIPLFAYWMAGGILMALRAAATGSPSTARALWSAVCDGPAGRFGNRNEHIIA